MKQMMIVCGVMLTTLNLLANPKPKADVHLKITDDLPKLGALRDGYNGICSVTNTGEVAFILVSYKDSIRFYREENEEQQRKYENVYGLALKRQREQERAEVKDDYYFGIEKYPETVKTLQPGESITFKCEKFYFNSPFGVSGEIYYKAEMYLGNDTWVPVHITPTLGTLLPVIHDSRDPTTDFFYSQEGTNQYLYVKVDEKFKRISEMKLGSRPRKDWEGSVTFDTLDGTQKKLTHAEARQIIDEREQKEKGAQ